MLMYTPEVENHSYYTPITFRELEIKEFSDRTIEILKAVEKTHPQFETKSVEVSGCFGKSRKFIEETAYDKTITLQLIDHRYKDVVHTLKILFPKLIKYRYLINNVLRFPVFQIIDTPFIMRKNEIRFTTNIKHLIIQKNNNINNKNKYSYYLLKNDKTQISFINILLGKYGIQKLNEILKGKVVLDIIHEPKKVNTLSDIISYKILDGCGPNLKNLIDDLLISPIKIDPNKYDLYEKTFYNELFLSSYKTYDFYEDWNTIEILDIYTKKLMKHDDIFIEILNMIEEPIYNMNDLNNKRIRSLEYINQYIINYIYNLKLKNIKRPLNRIINMVDILIGKEYQDLLQQSKTDFTISLINELFKTTYTGKGGLSKDNVQEDLRDLHSSYLQKLDPIFTPDGEKCGIVNYLTINCKLDNMGRFI